MQCEKVLVVDDEENIRRLLSASLAPEGYACREAASAEQALAMLAAEPADLVVLDIKMPGKSGMAALADIKAAYPETAVIMITALTDMNLAIRCMKDGASDYLLKPFSLEEIIHYIARALEKRRLELRIKEYQLNLEQKVAAQTREMRALFLGAIESLVFALEAKDKYTAGHSRRVTELAVALGAQFDLAPATLEDLRWGALLHDVGKIAVDQDVLNKPGKLTREEYEHIMVHPRVGADIVKPVVNAHVVEIIAHHHDRYNGTGLGQELAGEAIPLGARILALADAYDAMTSERPYRPPRPRAEALAEIARCRGADFDPAVAEAFLTLYGAAPPRGTLHSLAV